jgi:AcrR family transcriptional regulator
MTEGRKRRVRKTKTQRQREIAEATLLLVGKYGLQGTTVSRIATAVGLTKGALYRHFQNRDAVLMAAMDLLRERATSWLDQSSGADVLRRLLDMADRHADWAAAEFETFIRPVMEFAAAGAAENLTAEMSRRQLSIFGIFCDLVEQGKREGSIRNDIETGDVAWSLLGFAWAQDVARMQGVEQYITEGASLRNFKRMLADFATDPTVLE